MGTAVAGASEGVGGRKRPETVMDSASGMAVASGTTAASLYVLFSKSLGQ